MMKQLTKKDVLSAIQRSGYPLEQRVAVAFEQASFSPVSSWTWWDDRREVERELDVTGELLLAGRDSIVAFHVLAECKLWRPGVVVFESPLPDDISSDTHFWGQPSAVLITGSPAGIPTPEAIGWVKHWRPRETAAFQFGVLEQDKAVAKTKEARRSDRIPTESWKINRDSDAHGSLDGLCRALLAYQEEYGRVAEGVVQPYLNFAALLLIVEGPIFAYRVGRRGGARAGARKVSGATFYHRGLAPDGRRVMFRVDFIREPALPGLLQELASGARSTLAQMERKSDLFRESVMRFGNTSVRVKPSGE